MSMRNRWIALAGALALAGCGVLPDKEAIAIYAPMPTIAADPAWPQVGWQLQVARPSADSTIDSGRIAVRPVPGELQVYKGARWAQPVSELVHRTLVRGFEDSGRIRGVSARNGDGIAGQYILVTDVRRFDADYAGAASPTVHVELIAKLVPTRDSEVVATRLFNAQVPARATDVASVTQAFEQALGQVGSEVIGWTLREGQRHAAGHR